MPQPSLRISVIKRLSNALGKKPESPHPCKWCRQGMEPKTSTVAQRGLCACCGTLLGLPFRYECRGCKRHVCAECAEADRKTTRETATRVVPSGTVCPCAAPNPVEEPLSPSPLPDPSSSASLGEVSEQPEAVDEDELCIICFDRPAGTRLEPCGHNNFCAPCAMKFNTCPLCVRPIRCPLLPAAEEARIVRSEGMRLVNGHSWTALHQAASQGDAVQVARYLEAGVVPDVCTQDHSTPLHHASHAGHVHVVRTLLLAGASTEACDSSGATPLIVAACFGHEHIVRELMAAGADLNARDLQQMTALHWAARMSREPVCMALITAGAQVNPKSGHGYTPFAMAEDWGTAPMARLLKDLGGHR